MYIDAIQVSVGDTPNEGRNSHGILHLPDEILLQIALCLDFRDITALRLTCKRFCTITQDRSAWLQLLREQSQSLPLPSHLSRPSCWIPLSSSEVERTVRILEQVQSTWLLPRSTYFIPGHADSCTLDPVFNHDDGSRMIYSINIFLDRWLLCVYYEKLVELWDLDPVCHNPNKPILCTSQQIKGVGSFSSSITHLDEHSNLLTIAVSCHELCHILQVQLCHSSAIYSPQPQRGPQESHFRTIATIPFASPIFCLRALDPSHSLLLLGLPSSFYLLNWVTNERTVVNMLAEGEEELWNGVVAAMFLTSRHILVLKSHSLEVCTLLDSPQVRMNKDTPNTSGSIPVRSSPAAQMSAAVFSHFFPGTTFRGVSFSKLTTCHPTTADPLDGPIRVSLTFLAYDVLRGLFHYSVLVTIPYSESPPIQNRPGHLPHIPIDVRVRLLAAHNMAIPVAPGEEMAPISRSGFSHGSRGFVSACALGPTGRRGVWVERSRGAVRRAVYGFSSAPAVDEDNISQEYDESNTNFEMGLQPSAVQFALNTDIDVSARATRGINGTEVYNVNSYDLRDDITHIAISETTGLIALGTRKGDIRVLGRAKAASSQL